jgi:hypothetical protein
MYLYNICANKHLNDILIGSRLNLFVYISISIHLTCTDERNNKEKSHMHYVSPSSICELSLDKENSCMYIGGGEVFHRG